MVSHLDDHDMQKAPAALLRAAKRARQIAQETGTELVVVRNGKLVCEVPQEAATKPRKKKATGQ